MLLHGLEQLGIEVILNMLGLILIPGKLKGIVNVFVLGLKQLKVLSPQNVQFNLLFIVLLLLGSAVILALLNSLLLVACASLVGASII